MRGGFRNGTITYQALDAVITLLKGETVGIYAPTLGMARQLKNEIRLQFYWHDLDWLEFESKVTILNKREKERP